MAGKFNKLVNTLLIGGVGVAIGYMKCMNDVAEQHGEIEVKPSKHSKLTVRKRKEEEKKES